MRYVINTVLLGLIGFLAYAVYTSIKEPIAFGDEKKRRKSAVVTKLETIRKSQEIYRSIKGEFAGSFEELSNVLTNDSIPFVKIIEDPEDPSNTEKFQKIVTYTAAFDSIKSMGIDLASLGDIPFSEGKRFEIQADTVEYQKTNVAVVEVGTKWNTFMGEFSDPKYAKYDSKYDPNRTIKFGNMNKPSLAGSWDR